MTGGLWLKLKHGACSNPKWRAIAAKVGCPTGHVWTLYCWVLDHAGQHGGSLAGFDLPEVASFTDIAMSELQAIWDAFVEKAIVIGDQLRHWVEHQGIAAVGAVSAAIKTSTDRVRRCRDRKRDRARQGDLFAATKPETHETAAFHAGVSPVSSAVSAPSPLNPLIESDSETETLPPSPRTAGAVRAPIGKRAVGQNPREVGQNPRARGTSPRLMGQSPRQVQVEILRPIRGRSMTAQDRRREEFHRNIAVGLARFAERHGIAA